VLAAIKAAAPGNSKVRVGVWVGVGGGGCAVYWGGRSWGRLGAPCGVGCSAREGGGC